MPDAVSAVKSSGRPWYSPLSLLHRLVVYALIAYVTLCVFLFFAQTGLLYPGSQKPYAMEASEALRWAHSIGLRPWEHTTLGSKGPQGYIRTDFTSQAPRGTIVMFHGNGECCLERTENVEAFTRRGFRVFLYEYPGYGGRSGRPSEAGIVPDAQALIRSLDQAGYGPIYVWGESLGSGVSAAVCADPTLPVHGLVLMMPWDTLAGAALAHYPIIPVSWLLKDKYDSITNLQHFQHPICVVRGDQDQVIPPSLTLNLFAHLPNPKKIILEEHFGHGDWPRTPDLSWWDEALNFIAPPRVLVKQ